MTGSRARGTKPTSRWVLCTAVRSATCQCHAAARWVLPLLCQDGHLFLLTVTPQSPVCCSLPAAVFMLSLDLAVTLWQVAVHTQA